MQFFFINIFYFANKRETKKNNLIHFWRVRLRKESQYRIKEKYIKRNTSFIDYTVLLQESLYCDSYIFSSVEKLSIKKQKHVVCNIYKTSEKNITDNAWIEPLRNESENIKIGQSNVYRSIETENFAKKRSNGYYEEILWKEHNKKYFSEIKCSHVNSKKHMYISTCINRGPSLNYFTI